MNNNFRVKIFFNDNILCKGDGKNLEEAKEKAAENGLKILSLI
jgi:dsRNA-specific ribonuclease